MYSISSTNIEDNFSPDRIPTVHDDIKSSEKDIDLL